MRTTVVTTILVLLFSFPFFLALAVVLFDLLLLLGLLDIVGTFPFFRISFFMVFRFPFAILAFIPRIIMVVIPIVHVVVGIPVVVIPFVAIIVPFAIIVMVVVVVRVTIFRAIEDGVVVFLAIGTEAQG